MNPWIAHVKAYASEQKVSYGQALKDAKTTYKAKSPQTEAKAPQTEAKACSKPKAVRKPRKKAIPSLPEPKDVGTPCM